MKLLLHLVLECICYDTHAIVPNSIATEVQLSNSLTVLEHILELAQTFETDIVLFKGEHLKVALFAQSSAQGQSTFWEDSISGEPYLSDVLSVL